MRLRLVLLVSTMTAVAVAAGLAVAQPKKDEKKPGGLMGAAGSAAGSGSAKPAGSGSAANPTTPTTTGGTGSGTTAGSGEDTDEPPTSDEPGVDALRQEYLKLRDELFESRARAAAVASQLYSTKVTIKLTYTSGRMYGVSRASIRLDGASVYDDTSGTIANDDGIRFEGFIAPGRHVLAFRVEAGGKDDARFTSATESTVVIEAVAGKDLLVAAKAKDGGDIPYAWKKKEKGTYKLGLDIDVRSFKRATEKKASTKSSQGNATASR
jgi:hypothetical protein